MLFLVAGWIPRAQQIGPSLVEPANWPRCFALTSLQHGQPTHRCIFRCTNPLGVQHTEPSTFFIYIFFFSSSTHWDGSREHHQALDLYICHISLLINSKHLLAWWRGVKSVSLPRKEAKSDGINPELWTPSADRWMDGESFTEHCSTRTLMSGGTVGRERLMKCMF